MRGTVFLVDFEIDELGRPHARHRCRPRRLPDLVVGQMRFAVTQRDSKGRSDSKLALDPDGAAVKLDIALHERQADSRARVLTRFGRIRLREAIEDGVQLGFRDAGARVAHRDLSGVTARASPTPRSALLCR